MKTFSQLPKQRSPHKEDIVVSILNSEIPSLTEELILRTGNRISKDLDVPHLVLVLKSPISESDIFRKYIERFSDSFNYISNIKEAKDALKEFNSQIVCGSQIAESFHSPITIKNKHYPILESVLNGDVESFVKYSFNDFREIDCRHLFNIARESNSLEEIKEKIEIPKNDLRERFFNKEIFNVGETVNYKGEIFEILDRGSNYLVIVDVNGNTKKSWVTDLSESSERIHWKPLESETEISYKGYETKNFHKISEELRTHFKGIIESSIDPLLALKTIKLMDEYISTENTSIKEKLSENLDKIKEDVMSSDFKLGKDGRKVRARRITFANKVNGKKDASEEDEQVQEELDIKLEYHEVLNPKLWENDELIPLVRNKLVQIADKFEDFLDKDGKIITVVDVIITGSNCNYNYAPLSDIDLHLIVDLSDVEDKELMSGFLTAKKTLWKDQHDITIKGYDVELYAQDKDDKLVATGMYSIRQNKWIEKPKYLNLNIDHFTVQSKACDIINQIEHILSGNGTVEQIDCVKEKIRKLRQTGLSKGGEFSVENLAFKAIRNNGYFDKLNNLKKGITDKQLSLESNGTIVMDKNRTDNGSRGILSHEDLMKLIAKLKTPITPQGDSLGGNGQLRTQKIKYHHGE